MSCPTDTDPKRLTRFLLYRRAKNLWLAGGQPEGAALVLAGTEASEIGCLRDFLEWSPSLAHFIDQERTGLDIVAREWKKAQTFHGDVVEAIAALRGEIAFLNLDFCGFMNNRVIESIETGSLKMAEKGVVAYTFTRDRESALTPNWDLIKDAAERAIANDTRFQTFDRSSPEWMDTVRFVGYSSMLKQSLGPNYEPVFMMRYKPQDARSMGVLAFQNMPVHMRIPAWRKELMRYRSAEERTGMISNTDLREKLRDLAMQLTDTIPSRKVASILHLPTGTMAAWQAHKTRGTYRRFDDEPIEGGEA